MANKCSTCPHLAVYTGGDWNSAVTSRTSEPSSQYVPQKTEPWGILRGCLRVSRPPRDSRRQNPLPKSASRFGATSKSVRTGGDSNKPCRRVVLNTPNKLMSRGIYHHSTLPREPCPALQNFADASIVREQRGSDQLGPKIYYIFYERSF